MKHSCVSLYCSEACNSLPRKSPLESQESPHVHGRGFVQAKASICCPSGPWPPARPDLPPYARPLAPSSPPFARRSVSLRFIFGRISRQRERRPGSGGKSVESGSGVIQMETLAGDMIGSV